MMRASAVSPELPEKESMVLSAIAAAEVGVPVGDVAGTSQQTVSWVWVHVASSVWPAGQPAVHGRQPPFASRYSEAWQFWVHVGLVVGCGVVGDGGVGSVLGAAVGEDDGLMACMD